MNFRLHVEAIVKKIRSVNGILYSRRDYIPQSCRKNLYFALVQSRVQYCLETYGHTSWNVLQPLYIACNRVLRTLLGLSRFSHVKDMYAVYNILPIHLQHKLFSAKIIYKSINNNPIMSAVTSNMFQLNHASHSYPTRLSKTNYLYKKSGPAFYKSYVNAACTDWNLIPIDIRNAKYLSIFIGQYKKYLFDTW